ncbi:hypothetical protein A4G99_09540 [Haladaptatus sp. R4]|uniref:hypothetical protein n=1 Tax=Haladaptatus sp. R4 TaxID=1679489 RepID=UPI0007B4D6EA|nr:hypothetical protein [Haladaptatus sp. R4]KZN24596.1 hypothetical protein A4G99_09540 [Haladaptatus sp. R4]
MAWRRDEIAPITLQKQLTTVRVFLQWLADIDAVRDGLAVVPPPRSLRSLGGEAIGECSAGLATGPPPVRKSRSEYRQGVGNSQ